MAKRSGYSQSYFAARRAAMRNGTFIGSAARRKREKLAASGPKPKQVRTKRSQNTVMTRVDGISVPVPSSMRKATIDKIRALPENEQGIAVRTAIMAQQRTAIYRDQKNAARAAANPPPTEPPKAAPSPRRGIRSLGEAAEPPVQPTSRDDRRAAAAASGRTIGPATTVPEPVIRGIAARGETPPEPSEVTTGQQPPAQVSNLSPANFNPIENKDYKTTPGSRSANPLTEFLTRPTFSTGVDNTKIKDFMANGRKFNSFDEGVRHLAEMVGADIEGVSRETTASFFTNGNVNGSFMPDKRMVYMNTARSKQLEKALTTGDFSDIESRKALQTLVHEFYHAKDAALNNLDSKKISDIDDIRSSDIQFEMMLEGPVEYQALRVAKSMLNNTDVPNLAYKNATEAIALYVDHAGENNFQSMWSEDSLPRRQAKFNNDMNDVVTKTLTDSGFTPDEVSEFTKPLADRWSVITHINHNGLKTMLDSSRTRQGKIAAGKKFPGGIHDDDFRIATGKFFNQIMLRYGGFGNKPVLREN